MTQNLLAEETSPYLLQHADNPVHWRPWGPAALVEAKERNVPVLLSVGYAACHWCHVMAHESFEDGGIAGQMNDLFVNIKVDREERPDIDQIYQRALQHLGQQGGWPLTMFLTPDGEPFWGGTYFPPESRYGRPGFPEVLTAISDFYSDKQDRVAEAVTALRDALSGMANSSAGAGIPLEALDQAALRLAGQFDMVNGGLGGAPKFPNPSIHELVWRGYLRTGDAAPRDAILLALDKMSLGGIYDHLGGGYARYSTDEMWLAPHFEKMLYDNAQLIDLLRMAWQETRKPLYEVRIRETIDWIDREMISEGGGFAATLDADSEGEEGKFYVWQEAEIDAVLGDAADLFKRAYQVKSAGNWEGKTILNRNHDAGPFSVEEEQTLLSCRHKLLDRRAGRIRPGWDDKVLADWNGLQIAAMARASMTFDAPDWLKTAKKAFHFIIDTMQGDANRLFHSWRAGKRQHTASLDDYANMAEAAIALYEATGDLSYIAAAEAWVAVLDAHYWDSDGGGYFFTADDAEALIVRAKHAHDNATPAGNGVIAGALAKLHMITGKDAYRLRAETVIAAFSGEMAQNFFPLATLMNASETLQQTAQVVVIAPDPMSTDVIRAAAEAPHPSKLIVPIQPDADLPEGHPAAGKSMIDSKPTAYICVGPVCSLPITDADAVRSELAHPKKATNKAT